MELEEIKKAVTDGKKVYWSNKGYEVQKDKHGKYLIVYLSNKNCIGLTHLDGITLNGNPEQFFME